ncbi:hypothetical protein I317_03325 [Kwoniella heveanensis CBS 569]|nr:hypothetical protein I317_03325 [Kwoniella heveanensis CBS 569]
MTINTQGSSSARGDGVSPTPCSFRYRTRCAKSREEGSESQVAESSEAATRQDIGRRTNPRQLRTAATERVFDLAIPDSSALLETDATRPVTVTDLENLSTHHTLPPTPITGEHFEQPPQLNLFQAVTSNSAIHQDPSDALSEAAVHTTVQASRWAGTEGDAEAEAHVEEIYKAFDRNSEEIILRCLGLQGGEPEATRPSRIGLTKLDSHDRCTMTVTGQLFPKRDTTISRQGSSARERNGSDWGYRMLYWIGGSARVRRSSWVNDVDKDSTQSSGRNEPEIELDKIAFQVETTVSWLY